MFEDMEEIVDKCQCDIYDDIYFEAVEIKVFAYILRFIDGLGLPLRKPTKRQNESMTFMNSAEAAVYIACDSINN